MTKTLTFAREMSHLRTNPTDLWSIHLFPLRDFTRGTLIFAPTTPWWKGILASTPPFLHPPPPLPPPRTNGHLDGGRGLRHVRRGVNSAERIRGVEIRAEEGVPIKCWSKRALKQWQTLKKTRPLLEKQNQSIKAISFHSVINFLTRIFFASLVFLSSFDRRQKLNKKIRTKEEKNGSYNAEEEKIAPTMEKELSVAPLSRYGIQTCL